MTYNIAEWIFGLAAALLLYTYLGYPFLLFCISLCRRRRTEHPDHRPTVSVLIAAYNEERRIAGKLRETLASQYPAEKLEVVVASDGSTDATDQLVRSFADDRVRLVRVEGRRGKTHAQNEAVKLCRGEVIVFSDATAVYHPASIARLVTHYADPLVGAVSGRYKYFDAEGDSPTGLGSVAFWNYENVIKLLQSRIGTLTGCSGCIYSVRKSCYTPLPDDACSDLVEPLYVVKAGYRVAFEPAALAYEETTVTTQQEFRMRVRVGTRGMRGILSVRELLNPFRRPWVAFQLLSHKIMRWLVPVYLIVLFTTNAVLAAQPTYAMFLVLQACFYALAAASLMIPVQKYAKPLALPLFFCALNAAVALSLLQVIRGKKFTIWETVRRDVAQAGAPMSPGTLPMGATTGNSNAN